jgi:hypothetical protein
MCGDVVFTVEVKRKKVYLKPRVKGVFWSEREKAFLAELYKLDKFCPNRILAELCSIEFSRNVTENAIRGALTRLRKSRKVALYRKETLYLKRVQCIVDTESLIEQCPACETSEQQHVYS